VHSSSSLQALNGSTPCSVASIVFLFSRFSKAHEGRAIAQRLEYDILEEGKGHESSGYTLW
jgi:hypothetical protein